MRCRNCAASLDRVVLDLCTAPPSNAYLTEQQLRAAELWLPLRVMVCEGCWLVQTEDVVDAEDVFTDDYAYFSSVSPSWLAHVQVYVGYVVDRFDLGPGSLVVEVASNDGYLLQFVRDRAIPCVGIEPTASTAEAARDRGLTVEQVFLGQATAAHITTRHGRADLVVANNVLAHVPDLDDFVHGLAELVAPTGVLTVEFPTVTSLVDGDQWDTVYHEHFSYFSLTSAADALGRRGLEVFDVEEIPTHGGSLRVFAQHAGSGAQSVSERVSLHLQCEAARGVVSPWYYGGLQAAAEDAKVGLLEFLVRCRRDGLTVAAYGAAAKGNTLLNFAGVRGDLLAFVCDRSPGKTGRFLPGSRIPILPETALAERRPDLVLLLPWNLRAELEAQLGYCRGWGARFAIAVPSLEVW